MQCSVGKAVPGRKEGREFMSNLHSHFAAVLLEMGAACDSEERPAGAGCFAIKTSSVQFSLGMSNCAIHLGLEIEMFATAPSTTEVLIAFCTSI